MMFRLALTSTVAALSVSTWAVEDAATASHVADMEKGTVLFKSDVAALLTDHCVKCHGGEKGTKGALDLTTRELALKGGDTGPAFVPGKSAESLLVQSIRHEDKDLQMPKKEDKLPEDAIAKIAQWVDLGAPYAKPLAAGKATRDRSKVTAEDRKFWSFQSLAKPSLPEVKDENWCHTPVDRFILAKIEEKGILPSPPADKVVLIRRAYFDLIGLPPTPEQVEKYVNDTAPNAFEKVVDELLASPHYGERWGRHWLDLARYAESHGYEQDYDRPNAYHYRDYVIRALNADQPYDEFVRWQIAGDELAPANPDAWMATGFLAAGTHATQITANQAEKERYDELDDMAATTGNAILGLSVGCARCHDHKYDPIPSTDYYRLISTFTTAVRSDYDIQVNPAENHTRHAAWEKEHAPLTAALAQWEKEQAPARFATWKEGAPALPQPAWLTLTADKLGITGTYYVLSAQKNLPDGSYLIGVTAGTPDTYTFTTKIKETKLAALRLEALLDKTLPGYGPGWSASGGFNMSDLTATAKLADGQTKTLKFSDEKQTWNVAKSGEESRKVFPLAEPLEIEGSAELTVTMKFVTGLGRENLGRFRLSFSSQADAAAAAEPFGYKDFAAAREGLPAAEANPAQIAALQRLYCTTDPEWQKLAGAVRAHERTEPRVEYVKALVCSEGLPAVRLHTQGPDFYEKTYQLKRGDLNQKQEEAVPGFLQVVTRGDEARWNLTPSPDARTPMKRAALARWITDADQGAGHLAARVIVNRLWQHHFGRGIVSTPSDFGAQGERPTHPELLDYLAGELIRRGWRLKPIHKLMMMSKVYQESARTDAAQIVADPSNALFSHRTRQRLEGEVIRDSILAVSGLLDTTMYGPGTLDPEMKRRAIYFQIKRSQLPPMLVAFDGPDTLQSMGLRSSTTVAPQSLLLMNNPLVREAAKAWAKRLDPTLGPAAVARAYQEALGRGPTSTDMAIANAFLKVQGKEVAEFGYSERALADFCQVLFGLNEFLYLD